MGKIRSMPISIAVSKKLFLNLYIMVMIGGLMMGAAIASTTDLGPTKNIFKIQSITIQGLKKVEKEAVLEKISSKEGMVLDNYLLRKDIKKSEEKSFPAHIKIGPLYIDRNKYLVNIDGAEKIFPRKEFELLYYLANNPGKVFDRDTLLKDVWGLDVYVVDRTVDVHIRKIREKLRKHANLIETVKGVGYKFKSVEKSKA